VGVPNSYFFCENDPQLYLKMQKYDSKRLKSASTVYKTSKILYVRGDVIRKISFFFASTILIFGLKELSFMPETFLNSGGFLLCVGVRAIDRAFWNE
jgi:hypothetical protein